MAGLGGVGIGAFAPLLTRNAIDIATGESAGSLTPIVLALLGLAAVRFGSSFLRRWAGGKLALDVQHDMRQDVFGSLSRLDGAAQDSLRTGQVVSRASSDLQIVQGLMFMVPLSAGQVVLFVLSLVFMVVLSPLLTLTAVLVVPAVFILIQLTRRVLFPATWSAQQAAAEVAEVIEENVTGVRVVKGFGQEDREVDRLNTRAAVLYRFRLRAIRLTARIQPSLTAVTGIGQVAVLALGGVLALNGVVTIGTFLAFSLYLAQLVAPTRTLSYLLIMAQQARASMERVMDLVDARSSVVDPIDPVPVPSGPLSVQLDGVRFGYTHDDPVLRGFDLEVPAGSTLALVGASGSGKSTISLLLPRFYDPVAGTLRVGGTDIRAFTLAELRRTVGVVFEDSFLFSDSIAANISFGRPDASVEDIRAAAIAAEADGFISALPQGYDTVIGERGLTLSGGQRQRLSLARAMLSDPRVLLLDDATSAVDPVTEAAIHDTLHRLTRDRTTILIAHRRSTLALADRIAVVAQGRVVAEGTHEDLLQSSSDYRALWDGGDDLDQAGTGVDISQESVDGLTPGLWPAESDPAPAAKPVAAASSRPAAAGGGPMGDSLGSVPATPELLAAVEALPPATDEPPARPVEDPAPFSLTRTLRPFKSLLIWSLVLVTLDAAALLAIPALTRAVVDSGVSAGSLTAVAVLSGATLVVVLVDYLIQRRQLLITGRAGEGVLYHLRLRLFGHLQRLGLDYFESERGGRIMTRMTTDVDALATFLQTGLITSVVSLTTFLGITVLLLFMDLGLALVAFSVLPPLILATWFFRRFSTRAYVEAREKIGAVNADLQENVSGLRITQALGRQEKSARSFADRSDDYRRSRMRAQTATSLYFPFIALLSEIAAAAVLGYGSSQVAVGAVSVGTLIAFVLYLDFFFTPIQQLSQIFDSYQQAAVGLTRIGEFLAIEGSTPPPVHPVPIDRLTGRVTFAAVGFRYSSSDPEEPLPPALSGIDLEIEPGETVAVVGATGAGKSTMLKLAARFYDVTEGAVLVDGIDVRDLDPSTFRQRLGLVPQEPHLFSGTVRDNIAFGRPEATDAEVEAAARSVGAIEVIAGLQGGFRHPVTERGQNLSAGQRQMISLARAHLVDPDVLLLDEATAALDPAAEQTVLAATQRLTGRRTTMVVAHRLSTAARADRIVVMADGRIVEIGPHDELLAKGGHYSRLYSGVSATT